MELTQHTTPIMTRRERDKQNNYVFQTYCQKIMRDLHGIPEDQLEYHTSGRKRVKAPPPPPAIDVTKRRVKRKIQE